MELFKLSTDERKKIAAEICESIDAWETAKGDLPQRWKRNEDIYNLVPGTASLQVIEGMAPYEIALARPKIDRVTGSVITSITGTYPYVQCINADEDGENDENLEKTLHEMAKAGNFVKNFRHAVLNGCITNLGILRIAFNETKGCEMEWVHPDNIMCYPAEFGCFKEAKTVGHRFKRMVYRITQKMDEDYYYRCDIKSGDDTLSAYEADSAQFAKTNPTPKVRTDDDFVTLYEVIHETNLVGGTYKKFLCTVAKETGHLLRAEEYPYSRANYFEVKLTDDMGKILSPNSLAQSLQGVQLAYSDTFSLLLHGGTMSAFPLVIVSGGQLPVKSKKYGPGDLMEVSQDIKVQKIDATFNPSVLPAMTQKLEEVADTIAGISRLGTAGSLGGRATATAASGFLQAQQEAKDQYTDMASPYVADMFEFLHELLKLHFDDVTRILGSRIPELDYAKITTQQYSYEVTGQSGASNPQILMQKLMFLMQLSQDPNAKLNPSKVIDRIIQSMDLPFSTRGLKLDGPGIEEMKSMLMGVIVGELHPMEVARMMGITPEMIQQFMEHHASTNPSPNSGIPQESNVALPQGGGGPAAGEPSSQPQEPAPLGGY